MSSLLITRSLHTLLFEEKKIYTYIYIHEMPKWLASAVHLKLLLASCMKSQLSLYREREREREKKKIQRQANWIILSLRHYNRCNRILFSLYYSLILVWLVSLTPLVDERWNKKFQAWPNLTFILILILSLSLSLSPHNNHCMIIATRRFYSSHKASSNSTNDPCMKVHLIHSQNSLLSLLVSPSLIL